MKAKKSETRVCSYTRAMSDIFLLRITRPNTFTLKMKEKQGCHFDKKKIEFSLFNSTNK